MAKDLTEISTIPFKGGQNTYNHPSLLPAGSFSAIQNMRQMRPGLVARGGMIKQHSTADGTNKVLSMFQFSKGKRTERHFYAQMSDDDVLEATTAPPGVTTGAFGSEVFSGSASSLPASWSVLNDKVLFSNGVDQHQICAGTVDRITKFIVYDSDTRLPDVPAAGADYTTQVNDASSTTVGVLDSLGNFVATTGTVTCTQGATDFTGSSTLFLTELRVGQPVYVDGAEKNFIATITSNTAATVTTAWAAGHAGKTYTTSNDCVLVCAPVMPNRVTFTVSAANGNASVAYVSYSSTTGWKTVAATDGTISVATKTMSGTGAFTWTQPTDAAPMYMFGTNGFWVKIAFNAALDAEVEVSAVTYGSGFTSLQNVWDGTLVDAIEAQLYDSANSAYKIYGSTSITLNAAVAGDEVYFNSADPIVAAYIDVGALPNTAAAITIDHFEYLSSSGAWTSVGTYSDGTSGLSKSGYITFARQSGICQMQFNGLPYASYWYRFGVSDTLSATVNIGIQVIPYYDITEFGIGLCNATWKDKSVFVFDQDPSYIYISTAGNSQILSSDNSAIYQVGDGRANKILCMKTFYNELLCAQEEKGNSGGCLTLVQGTKPDNLGKIILSNKYGVISSQALEVIETVEGGHNAFILSRSGILFSDGKGVYFIKGFEQVRNYFDPTFTADCIRTGYESKMYLKYDSSFHVLKIGLVVGTSATEVNKVLVYDLLENCFSTDSYQYPLACECEVEAGSGNAPIIQLGGGQADGTVYVLNSGVNDVSTAVDAYVTLELNARGKVLRDKEMIIRCKCQSAGTYTVTPYHNGVIDTPAVKTLSMVAENTSDRIRRHRFNVNFKNQNVSLKIDHNTAGESFYLTDYGIAMEDYTEQ